MDRTDRELLLELQKRNKWWSEGQVDSNLALPFQRADYFNYVRLLSDIQYADIVFGPRQVGKSTVVYQLIRYLLTGKKAPDHPLEREPVAKNRILFLPLDSTSFDGVKNPIKSALKIFEENVLREPIEALKEPIYVFLDEASRRDEWALEVKEFIDMKSKIKFFITGSSSPALFQKSSESLVGRHQKTLMLPLKFRDMLRLTKNEDWNKITLLTTRNHLVASVKKGNPKGFFREVQRIFIDLGDSGQKRLQLKLNEYLLRGGYPRFYDEKEEWENASKVMREGYFEAILSWDIVKVFGSRNPEKLKQLYTFLALSTAQSVNVANLSRDLGLGRITVDDYIHQLQQTHLIKISELYKPNRRKASNDFKKIYAGDVGFRNAVLGLSEQDASAPDVRGLLVETVLYDHVLRLKYCLEPKKKCEAFFWRNKQKEEVDVLVELSGKLIPVESKYTQTARTDDARILGEAVKKLKSPFGLMITKDEIGLEGRIIKMPAWLFFLLC